VRAARLRCFLIFSLLTSAVYRVAAAEIPGGFVSADFSSENGANHKISSAERGTDLAARLQVTNKDLYASLRSFVCDESVNRTRANLRGTKIRKLDTLTARVSFENGREQYTDVRQNSISRPSMEAVGGAWSEGEFGTLLRQTQELLKGQDVTAHGSVDQNGRPVAVLSFQVSQQDSPWTFVVAGQTYRLPFRTEVTVESESGRILTIKRRASHVPAELFISEIAWSVELAPTALQGSTWLLPVRGEFSVAYANSDRVERNTLSFANYRRYGSEVAVRFDALN
jgi:hypothetical protein